MPEQPESSPPPNTGDLALVIETTVITRVRVWVAGPRRPSWKPDALASSIRIALGTGLLVGLLAGLFDGFVRTLGIDPGLFLIQWQEKSLEYAFTNALPQKGDLLGLLGCAAAAATWYTVWSVPLSLVLGVVGHFVLRRAGGLERWALPLWLGLWFFLEVYWWTRAVIFPGLPATSLRRIGAAAILLVVCVVVGRAVASLLARLPQRATRLVPVIGLAVVVAGGGYYVADLSSSSAGYGKINNRNRDKPNVLIFVVDALRQDVLGCYGNEHVKTPVLDQMAEEGVVFADAFAQAPFTWTSFGSFLTGKYPRRHGLVLMVPGAQLPDNLTLPEYLHSPGKHGSDMQGEDVVGAAFLTGTLSHGSGLARGFDYYFEAMVGHELVDIESRWSKFRSGLLPWLYKNKLHQKVDNQLVASTAIDWFKQFGSRRFVSMVHYYSTHTPYDPPAKYRDMYCDPEYDGPFESFYAEHRIAIEQDKVELTPADVAQIQNLYYAGVTQADAMIGDVLDELERQGVLDDTIVVVTSDHGESLGEHGLWEHNFMYNDNLRIPLLMRYPRGLPQGKVVEGIVDSIDMVPTLTDLMGLEPLPHEDDLEDGASNAERMKVIDGTSLLPLVRGDEARVRLFSFAENGRYCSIQDQKWKLIIARKQLDAEVWAKMKETPRDSGEHALEKPRFFDIAGDPLEENDLYETALEEHAETVESMWMVLRGWNNEMPHVDIPMSDRDLESMATHLKALGYGSGVGDTDALEGGGEEDGSKEEDGSEDPNEAED